MLNKKFIVYVLGLLLIIEGVFMLVCAGVSCMYGEDDLKPLLLSTLITFGVGTLIRLSTRSVKKDIGKREGYLVATLVWIVFSVFGALPFLLGGYIPSFTDAFF
jgi:trk system potassium uptake protein TrkH